MGYSCSARASFTLDAVRLFSEFDDSSENWKYFLERGRENVDGSITGIVYEITGPKDEKGSWPICKKGSFKIDANGEIVRFPGLARNLWDIALIHSIEMYDKEFSPLKEWKTVIA